MTAEQLKHELERRGLSHNALSRMAGVSQSTISGWLGGKLVPSETMREKIVNALMGGRPEPSPEEEAAAAIMDALAADAEEELMQEEPGESEPTPPPEDFGGYAALLLRLAADENVTIEDDLGVEITIHADALTETDRAVAERICWAQAGVKNGAINRKMYARIIERIAQKEAQA